MPLFIFSAVLTILLLFSWFVILPYFTRFEIAGAQLSAADLVTHKESLERLIREAQARRNASLLPVHDEAYLALKEERSGRMTFAQVRSELASIAMSVAGTANMIVMEEIDMDLREGTVSVRGDVRNAGLGSMTLLATFVEALRASPIVVSLTPPTFVREEGKSGEFHSPFTLEIVLKHSRTE